MIKTFEDFCNYYNKYGKCPGQIKTPGHVFNTKELLTRFQKYARVQERKKNKKLTPLNKSVKGNSQDEEWLNVSEEVHRRDNNKCKLLNILNEEEKKYLYDHCPYSLIQQLDIAHVISRSESSALYYEKDNLILLNRASHSWIDQYLHPIYGKPISKIERDNWWIKIIGKELYEDLQRRK